MYKNIKAMNSIVSISLLLIVVIFSAVSLLTWYNNYSSNMYTNIELESSYALEDDIKIHEVLSNYLYISNLKTENISLDNLKLNNVKCLKSSFILEPGMNLISLEECVKDLDSKKGEIFLQTQDNIQTKYFYFTNRNIVPIIIPIPTLVFSSNSTGVDYGDSINLSWNSSDANSCIASGNWSGSKPLNGSEVITNLLDHQTYVLNCSGEGGNVVRSVTVNVGAPPAPSLIFIANDTAIDYDDSVTLSWSSSDTTSCIASGNWSGSKSLTGSETFNDLKSNHEFILNCSGPGGSQEQIVNVNVASALDCVGPDSAVISHGGSKTYYLNSSVPYDQTCDFEVRECYNGFLNGFYTYSSCSINNCPFGTIVGLCSICDGQ